MYRKRTHSMCYSQYNAFVRERILCAICTTCVQTSTTRLRQCVKDRARAHGVRGRPRAREREKRESARANRTHTHTHTHLHVSILERRERIGTLKPLDHRSLQQLLVCMHASVHAGCMHVHACMHQCTSACMHHVSMYHVRISSLLLGTPGFVCMHVSVKCMHVSICASTGVSGHACTKYVCNSGRMHLQVYQVPTETPRDLGTSDCL